MRLRPVWYALAGLALTSCSEAPPASAPLAGALPPGVYATARGGGTVDEGGDHLQFSFIVKNQGLPGGLAASGTIDGANVKFTGTAKTVAIANGQVIFEGAGTLNGQAATFTVQGTDGNADALSARFETQAQGSQRYDIQGPLSFGHVDIETEPLSK